MTSQDTGGMRLPDGRAAASVCRREADPVSVVAYGVVWTHCTRGGVLLDEGWGATGRGVGCYWTRGGCNSGRWGPRAVRTTLVQWIPTLVEQADSRRSRRRVIASRPSAQVAGRERCRKICDGDAGHCRKTHGLSLLRGLVSTVLTLTGSASVHPAGIVGILRFLSGVQPRFGVNVSAVDTTPVTPHPFGPLASWTTSLPRVPARVSVSEVRRQYRFHQPLSQPHGEVHRQRSGTLCHPSRPRHRPVSIWTVTGHPTPPLLRRRRRCGAR